jgi:hypothetical protein
VNSLEKLLDFLGRLDAARIHYRLERNRDDALMVLAAVPGERWEVEFFADGHVEVEVFRSADGVHGEELLTRLFAEFSG